MEGLGKLLGAIGALLGAMLAFLGRSWALLGRLFGLMCASDLILGEVWDALRKFLGGFGEDVVRILVTFCEDLSNSLPKKIICHPNSNSFRESNKIKGSSGL